MSEPLIYIRHKLSHNGLTSYKQFENCNRKYHASSLSNLLNQSQFLSDIMKQYLEMYNDESDIMKRKKIIEQVKALLNPIDFKVWLMQIKEDRVLNISQSRAVKRYAGKLCYYSGVRKFESKKSGKFHMKVAFLTLTTPEGTPVSSSINAFNHFLDYLRRTANCVYVWKKELGEKNNALHYHILINNFIPYYIVAWKWKRLLLSEGVIWPSNEKGEHTNSHYRIELPRTKKLVSHYIAKYLSKAHELPKSLGYVWGKSSILDDCKETIIDEGENMEDELLLIESNYRVIGDKFVKHTCIDLLSLKNICPKIYSLFLKQYEEFKSTLTQPQRFQFI